MIPRTSIDEANRHLSALHKRVSELENIVKEQHEALIGKDEFLKVRIGEIITAKDVELGKLTEKLVSAEKTVDILQEQLRQKHQQVASLQKSSRMLPNVVSFKATLKELVKYMEDAENDMASQRDLLNIFGNFNPEVNTHVPNMRLNSHSLGLLDPNSINMMGNSMEANHIVDSDDMIDGVDTPPNEDCGRRSRIDRKTKDGEKRTKGKGPGREFYL